MKIKQQAEKKLRTNLRWQALQLIHQVSFEQAYSNVVINQLRTADTFAVRDKDLITQIVYGTIQHQMTLDFYLAPYIEGKKLSSWVRALLRMSAYQLIYLDRLPAHAVIDEAVKIAKLNSHQTLANLVNAVLRNLLRHPLRDLAQLTGEERLAVQYSLPQWLVTYFGQYLAGSQLEALLASLNQKPALSIRVNGDEQEREQLCQALNAAGYTTRYGQLSPDALVVEQGNPVHSDLFKQGKFTVQDESSMLVAPLGHLSENCQVLDACSAPGGKATHMLQLMSSGSLTALDISEAKLAKVAAHIQRLGLDQQPGLRINLVCTDAVTYRSEAQQVYDQIYLDAPCSGLGLMRRKPEIRYEKSMAQIQALTEIQAQLLNHMAQLLKVGGCLIYSTCTLSYEENEDMMARFLVTHPEFEVEKIDCTEVGLQAIMTPEGYIRIWPHQYHTDGFFIARVRRVK